MSVTSCVRPQCEIDQLGQIQSKQINKIKSRKLNYCVIQNLGYFHFWGKKNKFEHFPSFEKCQFSSKATPFHFTQWNIKKKSFYVWVGRTSNNEQEKANFVDEWGAKKKISDLIQNLHDTLQPNSKVFFSIILNDFINICIEYLRLKAILYSLFQIDVTFEWKSIYIKL